MEEIKGDASENVDEPMWIVDDSVSQEYIVVIQTTSEEEILGDNSTQNLTQTEDSKAKEKEENTRNEEQNVACAYKDLVEISNIQEINKALNNAEDSKLTERSYRSRSPINNQEVEVKNTRNEQGNIFTTNADTSILSVNQEEDKKINYFEEFEYCYPRSVSPGDLVIVETDEYIGNELENTSNLDTNNGNNSADVSTPSTSRENSNVQNVLPTADSNVHDKENEQNNDTSAPIGNVANISTDPNYLYPNGHFSRISNYDRRIGLYNSGSTCYVNSVMQALLATNKLSKFTVMKMYKHYAWARLAELFGNMMFTIYPVVNPRHIYSQFTSKYFDIFQQHDASEFLIYLLQLLWYFEPSWERNRSRSNKAQPSTSADLSDSDDNAVAGCSNQTSEPSPGKDEQIANKSRKYIENLFGSIIATMTTCQVCKNVSSVYETLLMMHLSFTDMHTSEVLTIQSLLNDYFSTEILTGDNSYWCAKCHKYLDATKTAIVVHTAKYLIIILKNFRYDTVRNVLSKKIPKVHCDENITLHSETNENVHSTYNLYAVIVHGGYSLNTGHYTAFTKYSDQWYKTNDKIVSSVDASEINNLSANEIPYILFYRRSDIKEGEFPEFDRIPWLAQYAKNIYKSPRDI